MREKRVYCLRQKFLEVMRDYRVPMTVDDILRLPELVFLRPTRSEALEAWDDLRTGGYIADYSGSNGEYRGIVAKGLLQINLETERDPFIWGGSGLSELKGN